MIHPANLPAFPHSTPDGAGSEGISRREYYAALNMAHMMEVTVGMDATDATYPDFLNVLSAIAVSGADALIRELDRTKPENPKTVWNGSAVAANVNSSDDMPF